MMKKTSFAISTDESRYVLNGIYSLKEHKMTMVATDGRRLALVDEEVDVSEKSQGEFIVPVQDGERVEPASCRKKAKWKCVMPKPGCLSLKDEKGTSGADHLQAGRRQLIRTTGK